MICDVDFPIIEPIYQLTTPTIRGCACRTPSLADKHGAGLPLFWLTAGLANLGEN